MTPPAEEISGGLVRRRGPGECLSNYLLSGEVLPSTRAACAALYVPVPREVGYEADALQMSVNEGCIILTMGMVGDVFFGEIVPGLMYTDGGSIPRVFWSVPGLSPWAFGPAYIVHDWLFVVHRCHWPAPPEVQAITFEQSAQILAEVGKSLV